MHWGWLHNKWGFTSGYNQWWRCQIGSEIVSLRLGQLPCDYLWRCINWNFLFQYFLRQHQSSLRGGLPSFFEVRFFRDHPCMWKTKVMMFWVANLMVLVESSLYFAHLEFTWECIACTCDAHVSWSLLVTRFSLTCGLLQIPVVHEIKQTWYTCGILFKYVIYLGYLSWAKVFIFMQWFDRSMVLEKNWVLYMCYSTALIVHFPFSKTCVVLNIFW